MSAHAREPPRPRLMAVDVDRLYDHVWWWRVHPPLRAIDRKGEPCRVLARGGKGTVLVEFPDGFSVFTSRYAVRRRKDVP